MLSFHYCRLIALQQQKYIQRLKKYLNLLVIPSPNLPLNDDFDTATHNAILNYKRQLNRRRGTKVVVEDGTMTRSLWQYMWGELWKIDRGNFQIQEAKTFDAEFKNLVNGAPYVSNFEEMRKCDAKMAEIFGGEGAVVSTLYEPNELKEVNGPRRENAGKPRPFAHSAIPCNDQLGTNDRGGIFISTPMNKDCLLMLESLLHLDIQKSKK